MITLFLIVLVLFLGFILFAAAVFGLFQMVKRHKQNRDSLVPARVRRSLNEDLEATLAKRQLDQVKRDWLESDGWVLSE